MLSRLAADAVLTIHLLFIVFALLDALLVIRWRWLLAVHLPAVAWAVFVEATGRICPLTYLENNLRHRAGQLGYAESFIERYLVPVIYPEHLTPTLQIALAGFVLLINAVLYGWLFSRWRRSRGKNGTASRTNRAENGQ